ncbi:MAG: hypothetical protein N3E51_03250 [Candidatus Micrarchaeota archaeon]|nr:hypothetical protein [Candidatus Micrarchaeota archaeon]
MPLCTPDFIAMTALSIAAVSIALLATLLGLAYMAAAFFRKPEYESFVSIELYQLGVSAFLMVSIFGFSCFAAQVTEVLAGSDPFAIARSYLSYISNNLALVAIMSMEVLKIYSQYMGSISMRWGLSVWGVLVPAFPSFVVIERVADFLLALMTPFTASLMVQQVIIEVIKAIALPFVLPAGAILRIFPPTRDAGTFLIASALGFQLVYPYTYVMHSEIVGMMLKKADFKSPLGTLDQNRYAAFSQWAVSQGGMFDIDGLLFRPLEVMPYILLQALFLPALSITLTIAFIKGTVKFISQKMG